MPPTRDRQRLRSSLRANRGRRPPIPWRDLSDAIGIGLLGALSTIIGACQIAAGGPALRLRVGPAAPGWVAVVLGLGWIGYCAWRIATSRRPGRRRSRRE